MFSSIKVHSWALPPTYNESWNLFLLVYIMKLLPYFLSSFHYSKNKLYAPPCITIDYSRSLALQEQLCLVQPQEQLPLLFDSVNT